MTMTDDCDGSEYCRATVHIEGCYCSPRPPDLRRDLADAEQMAADFEAGQTKALAEIDRLRAEVERLTNRLLFREADADRLAEALRPFVERTDSANVGWYKAGREALRQHEEVSNAH